MNELFSKFPRADIANLPTPVARLKNIGARFDHDRLYIKQDNLSGSIYGGNKIRKLEFLLGEAQAQSRKTVITYGAAGSNHALATAVCCRELGLKAVSLLAPQQSTDHVRKNILRHHAAGARMILCDHYNKFPELTRQLSKEYMELDGIEPYIIPAGGTNATGALGFVNAAFELKDQLTPDIIYLPMGTGGTHAGLLVGLKLAGLKTTVEAIRVTHPMFKTANHIQLLCDQICSKLNIDPVVEESDIIIRDDFFGEDYGISTPEADTAVDVFKSSEQIFLETTYTGKTVAGLLHDLKKGRLNNQTVLYWNTLNSRDFSAQIDEIDFHNLPSNFLPYFES
jgi:1-aminocyclopropane-1-carboxylate deaminase/D-cysteine desulfhydrase-like pyridoxal-dependent ACC family enzyme